MLFGKEIPRIIKLRKKEQIDHYMLFANRRLPANAETNIRGHIASTCSIPESSIYLCGLEQLELWLKTFGEVAKLADLDPLGWSASTWRLQIGLNNLPETTSTPATQPLSKRPLKTFGEVAKLADLDPIDSPLIVSPDELAEVVQALARNKAEVAAVLDDPPTQRVSYEEKNTLNEMTAEYAKTLRKKYLKETAQIRAFLSAPENMDLLRSYETVVDEFQFKIIAKRKEYQTFDKVMEYLLDLLFARDPVLRQTAHKRLTRAVLFYMYWNCDIGEMANAPTD